MIEEPPALGVGVKIDLKASVDSKALHRVGGHPAAGLRRRLDELHPAACGGEGPAAGQPGHSRANDDTVWLLHAGSR